MWKLLKLLREPAGRLAMDLIPDLVESIRKRRAEGESDQVIVRDIRSRLSDVAGFRAKRDVQFEEKFGHKVHETPTGEDD